MWRSLCSDVCNASVVTVCIYAFAEQVSSVSRAGTHQFQTLASPFRSPFASLLVWRHIEANVLLDRKLAAVNASAMVTTRSRSKAQLRSITEHFPEELWIEVLSHLGGKDIGRAVCATQVLANVRESVWRAACERRWPLWSQVAASADTHWKRQYELLELREKELDAVPCVQAINKLQKVVNPRHRMVLTEWLAEVRSPTVDEYWFRFDRLRQGTWSRCFVQVGAKPAGVMGLAARVDDSVQGRQLPRSISQSAPS